MKKNITVADTNYQLLLQEIKVRVVNARRTAARAINTGLVSLYWGLGKLIAEKQQSHGWGDSVVRQIATDLSKEFRGDHTFSPRNLWFMRQLYLTYSSCGQRSKMKQAVSHTGAEKVKQLVSEIPWGHNILILQKVASPEARLFYLQASAHFGWSRNVLLNQVKAKAYERQRLEKKAHNFSRVLPEALAEQADEALKSSYNLEFLGIDREIKERELEDRLTERLREFILELGYGFCFIGRQHRLVVSAKEYFVDLLFYHRYLKALVAVDLKIGPFEPEFAGKMDFYLNLLNQKEKAPDDQPSIGIILCAEKDDLVVEFSLKSKTNPIGVAEYHLTKKLPAAMKGKLPSERELREIMLSEARR